MTNRILDDAEQDRIRREMLNGCMAQAEQTRAMLAAVFGNEMAQSMMISILLYCAAQMVLQAGINPEQLWKERLANAWHRRLYRFFKGERA